MHASHYSFPKKFLLLPDNIFFQKERVNVLAEAAERKQQSYESQQLSSVSFEDLGKTIGRRWQALPPEERKTYEDLAYEDSKRYRDEMEAFNEAKRRRSETRGTSLSVLPSIFNTL